MTAAVSLLCCCVEPPPVGACCHDEGVSKECSDVTETQCDVIGGTWHPPINTCANYDCMPPVLCNSSLCSTCPDTYAVVVSWTGFCGIFGDPGAPPVPFSRTEANVVAKFGGAGNCLWRFDENIGGCNRGNILFCNVGNPTWFLTGFASANCVCSPPYNVTSCFNPRGTSSVTGCPDTRGYTPDLGFICGDPDNCQGCSFSVG